jgi:FlaG/FlaF family flagellin (archaellin)
LAMYWVVAVVVVLAGTAGLLLEGQGHSRPANPAAPRPATPAVKAKN